MALSLSLVVVTGHAVPAQLAVALRAALSSAFSGAHSLSALTVDVTHGLKLLEDAIALATKVNLDIGVIANVVHSTQLQSLAAMDNAASLSGTLPGILQCVQAAVNAPPSSPYGSLASGQTPAFALYGSSAQKFLRGECRFFCCN